MIEELTAAQIAARIGISERSVQRYIASGRLKATSLRHNKYAVDSDDINALILPEHHNDLSRIETLEQEVRRLADLVEQLRAERQRPTAPKQDAFPTMPQPARTKYISPSAEQDAIPARRFAEGHGLSRERMEKWIKQDAFATTPTPYGDRIQHTLTLNQQRAVIAYWDENHITYTHCAQCPH